MISASGLEVTVGARTLMSEVSFRVDKGDRVGLVGRNGAGKTTLLRCLMGLHRHPKGAIGFDGTDVTGRAPHQRARMGMGYVPDDRGIYASLNVEENLTVSPPDESLAWPLERIYESFPVLADRRKQAGTHLSGGEQQMLSLARVLRAGVRVVLADEPTEGLSPLLVQQIGDIFRQIKDDGVTVLLIEQNLHFATTLADRHHLIAHGRIVETLDNSEVKQREPELLEYLGI